MQKFISKFFGVFVCWILLPGCQQAPESLVTFQVETVEISSYSAQVVIRHDGTNRQTYYGFVVKGQVTDPQIAVDEYLAKTSAEDIIPNSYNQRKKVLSVYGLMPQTKYTYIVFGIASNGELYGKPAAVSFYTTCSDITFAPNDLWYIEYKPCDKFNRGYYTRATVYVDSTFIGRYFIEFLSVNERNACVDESEAVLRALEKFQTKNNPTGDKDFWMENTYVFTKGMSLYSYLDPDEYVAYAVGVEADGTPTGQYIRTESFAVTEYPPTNEYAAIMNAVDWTLTGADGTTNNFYFVKNKVNQSFKMYHEKYFGLHSVEVQFYQKTGDLSIYTQLLAENVRLKVNDSIYNGPLYFAGWVDGSYDFVTSQGVMIAYGTLQADGTYKWTNGWYRKGAESSKYGWTYVFSEEGELHALKQGSMQLPIRMSPLNK